MVQNKTPGAAVAGGPGADQNEQNERTAAASVGQTPMLDTALALLEKGLHIFPLGAVGEDPPAHFVAERFGGALEKARPQWPKQPRVAWKPFQTVAPSEETVRA